jgi:hypothetical protein
MDTARFVAVISPSEMRRSLATGTVEKAPASFSALGLDTSYPPQYDAFGGVKMSFYWRSVNLWNTRGVSYIETVGYSTPYNPTTSAALVEIVFLLKSALD